MVEWGIVPPGTQIKCLVISFMRVLTIHMEIQRNCSNLQSCKYSICLVRIIMQYTYICTLLIIQGYSITIWRGGRGGKKKHYENCTYQIRFISATSTFYYTSTASSFRWKSSNIMTEVKCISESCNNKLGRFGRCTSTF